MAERRKLLKGNVLPRIQKIRGAENVGDVEAQDLLPRIGSFLAEEEEFNVEDLVPRLKQLMKK